MAFLSKNYDSKTRLLSWLSFGVFLILVGFLFLVTPNLWDNIKRFFEDFALKKVRGSFYFPAPEHNHPVLYNTLALFCIAFGIYQVLLLILEFYLKVRSSQKIETFSNIVFWVAGGYLFTLLRDEQISWFVFVGAMILVIGTVVLTKALLKLLFKDAKAGKP